MSPFLFILSIFFSLSIMYVVINFIAAFIADHSNTLNGKRVILKVGQVKGETGNFRARVVYSPPECECDLSRIFVAVRKVNLRNPFALDLYSVENRYFEFPDDPEELTSIVKEAVFQRDQRKKLQSEKRNEYKTPLEVSELDVRQQSQNKLSNNWRCKSMAIPYRGNPKEFLGSLSDDEFRSFLESAGFEVVEGTGEIIFTDEEDSTKRDE